MRYLWMMMVCLLLVACGDKSDKKDWEDGQKLEQVEDTEEGTVLPEHLDTCQCDLLAFNEAGTAIYKDTAFNGKCHSYNKANGNKYEERLYLQGVVQWIKYYNNFGELITQYDYEDGVRKELSANCDCNKIEYKKVEGTYVAYYDGNVFDGYCRSFYPKGSQVYQEGKFIDGIKDGMHSVYDKSGNILTFEFYENGELINKNGKPIKGDN